MSNPGRGKMRKAAPGGTATRKLPRSRLLPCLECASPHLTLGISLKKLFCVSACLSLFFSSCACACVQERECVEALSTALQRYIQTTSCGTVDALCTSTYAHAPWFRGCDAYIRGRLLSFTPPSDGTLHASACVCIAEARTHYIRSPLLHVRFPISPCRARNTTFFGHSFLGRHGGHRRSAVAARTEPV